MMYAKTDIVSKVEEALCRGYHILIKHITTNTYNTIVSKGIIGFIDSDGVRWNLDKGSWNIVRFINTRKSLWCEL